MSGWDDPRMPTLSGIRRRGYTPEALRNFCASIGVSKTNGTIELSRLEYFVREDLNKRAPPRDGRAAPAQGGHRQLSRRPGRRDGGRQQSRGRRGGHAQSALLQGALHRAGRFPRRSAQGILPPLSRPRSAPALRLLHQVHRAWSKNDAGRNHRGALHLRPRDPRRQRRPTAAR